MSGFTVSPHEECAVEEAVRLTERHGGSVTVLTLGPPEAADQLRDMLALGATRAVLLETDGREWGPIATAEAIVEAVPRPRLRRLRPAAVRQRGRRHRGLPGRRPGGARARPALRHRHQEPGDLPADGAARGRGAGVPRRRGGLRGPAARRGLREGGHQPAQVPVAARAAAGQAGDDRAVRAAVAPRGPAQGAAPRSGRARPSGPRSSAPAPTPCPRWSPCSTSSGCCDDRAVPGRAGRRRRSRTPRCAP